jgi:hypothetical protein
MPGGRLTYQTIIQNKARKEIIESIPAMAEQAKAGNVQAFKELRAAGNIGDSGGIKIQNNIGIDNRRNLGDTEADWKFFQKMRGKLETSLMREALPPPDESEDSKPGAVQAESRVVEGKEGEAPKGV